MEDLQSETSSIHYSKMQKLNNRNRSFYDRIGCEEGLFELSNCNNSNGMLDFEQMELKLPLIFEDSGIKDCLFGISSEEVEGVTVNFKTEDHINNDVNFDLKSTTSSHLKSKVITKSKFINNSNKNYEKISLKSLHTDSTTCTLFNQNTKLDLNEQSHSNNIPEYNFLSISSNFGNEFDNNCHSYYSLHQNDKEEGNKNTNNKSNSEHKENYDEPLSKVNTFLYSIYELFKISPTLILDCNRNESLFIERIMLSANNEKETISFNNIFDLSLYLIHSCLLIQRKSGYKYYDTVYMIYLKIFSCTLQASKKEQNSNKKTKSSNIRKRGKTFFHNILLKLINCLLLIILKNESVNQIFKSLKFSDPHIKNNKLNMSTPTKEILINQSPQGHTLSFVFNKLLSDEIILSSVMEVTISQLLIGLLIKKYEDNYTDFFNSLLYSQILLENIKNSHGESISAEFNYYSSQFIEYLKAK